MMRQTPLRCRKVPQCNFKHLPPPKSKSNRRHDHYPYLKIKKEHTTEDTDIKMPRPLHTKQAGVLKRQFSMISDDTGFDQFQRQSQIEPQRSNCASATTVTHPTPKVEANEPYVDPPLFFDYNNYQNAMAALDPAELSVDPDPITITEISRKIGDGFEGYSMCDRLDDIWNILFETMDGGGLEWILPIMNWNMHKNGGDLPHSREEDRPSQTGDSDMGMVDENMALAGADFDALFQEMTDTGLILD
ncbi:hypothetical protein ABEF95_013351 [Exophiala dermatitidis]